MEILVNDTGPLVYVTALVAPLPNDLAARFALYENALELNAFQAEVRGGALAIDEERCMLLLCYYDDINELVPETLNGMVDTARVTAIELRQHLGLSTVVDKSGEDGADTTPPQQPDTGSGMIKV